MTAEISQMDRPASSSDRPLVDCQSTLSRPAANPVPARQRSRVTNGSALLPGTDGRSAWVRRAKELIADHLSDLGGQDNTSAAERSIVRRASVLTVELERLEARFATAGEASAEDLDVYARVASNLRRMLESVGLRRRPREVESLSQYLAALPAEDSPNADEAASPS
jgi:hypothetical protein